jgi:hypothetical protein
MSGALGLQEYIQLRPINNQRFPTATTASYIYTSGSTNDLYFTQFSGSFRNDVRLRWLEGALTTGLLNGGVISTANGTTTFSVTAGAGIIVSQNASITEDPYPTIEYVKWPAFVSASLDYSGSAQITYVAVDSTGALTQLNTTPTLAQYKDRIFLGRVLHQTGSVSNGAINSPAMAYAVSSNIFDFIRPFGPLKVNGHVLAASGSTLGLTKTEGDAYSEGRNYAFDPTSPNTILAANDPALVDCKIYYEHVSGSTAIINTGIGNAGFAVIDRAQYNNGGTLAAVGNSEWTNQRVYWFPKSVNRALFVYYGSAKYGTLLEAVAGLLTENFVEGDNTKGAAIYVGSVSVKGNETSLADTTNVRITQGGLFRAAGGGGGGGSTSPGGLTTQVQFNDAGAFGGDANFTFNNITHALTVIGDITGSRVTSNAAGSLAIGGGQVYLNGASSNRIDFSSQGTGDPAFNAPTAGTKVVLYPAAGASATDYALGISPATLWQSLPQADPSMMFKWYGGTTILAALSGSGNMEISGDLAVNGGDLTTTAVTFNLVTGSAATVNFAQSATAVAIGAAGGRTTVAHDLAIGTGNIIGAPGSGANVMTLLSSGNIVAKLDVDNNAAGHKFIVQDYNGASQFSVGEDGNAELTGSLVVTGSITALAGFSGSLTKLANGSDYLLPGSNVSLSTGSSGAITINAFSTSIFSGIFGDGADGDVTITAGTTTLSRDMMYNNLTIQNAGILKPRGFHIYVKGTLTINAGGRIDDNGVAGGTGVSGGTALANVSTSSLGGGSGAGGAGRTTTGVGNPGATSSNCSANALNQQPLGGVGGAITSPAIAGGNAGPAPGPTILQKWTSLPSMLTARLYNASATWNGGSGGGGGALDLAGGGTGTSGNGGSGGGIVWVAAKSIVNNGSISANGGAGGNGVTVGSASAGGGAGGGGGLVGIWTTTTSSLGTVTANAGAVGTGSGTAPGAAVLGNAGCIGIVILG